MVSQNKVFRQIMCYLAELLRQIVCYSVELYHHIVCYLAQLFYQIAFPDILIHPCGLAPGHHRRMVTIAGSQKDRHRGTGGA